ncbi:uncharacterized protein A4U43_C03F9560 [Asparagus officinalis]|uniref:C2H2-type domain-containing protein n=1 Tax=Asparagus officinalis TaxID=4686 RepID=A0A5P1FDQ1_ASPOF|nr:uncharacterized protein LOC109833315 [Asparagus officinalis]ONK74731.1 uncharacterized protein A4U43_C03F9560 [Asparagus officinalis]
MPTVWISLKKSLHCKSEPSDVVDPKSRAHHHHQPHHHHPHLSSILTRKAPRSGCSRSIANLKDVVIHGSKRHLERPASCSPRSIGSSDFLNPITHEVILSGNSKCELKITGFGASCHENDENGGNGLLGSTFVGTLRPGTPGPGAHLGLQYNPSVRGASSGHASSQRKSPLSGERVGSSLSNAVFGNGVVKSQQSYVMARASLEGGANGGGSANVSCHRCGEQFSKWQALESHHLSKHAVTELAEGDSSRKIVEIICRTSWLKSESNCGRIERVLKVHNMQKTLARFEEHRETVKIKASKLSKKHPRCLADGNELLRFYGTTIACSLGMNGSSSLCLSEKCNVCRVIRQGFLIKKGEVGVFTTSTSGRAFDTIEVYEENPSVKKALMVCRVIAGRVHKPLDNFQEFTGQSGFDSLAGKVGLYSNIEELYLLNPKALLPCFVVICKP